MIDKQIAEWLKRYTDKHGVPKAAKCAKCLSDPKLEVEAKKGCGTGRLVCSNPSCGNSCFGATSEDSEELIRLSVADWNKRQREIIREEAKKSAKKK